MITPTSKIEVHYFFRDETHGMNAFTRNECEKELLQIFKEICASLEIDIELESEAFLEGGLREKWNFIGRNSAQITLIIAVLTIFISRFPVENRELVRLQIENLRLDNELKKRELLEIKNEVETDEDLTDEIVERVLNKLDTNYKLIWHKSNYYKKLTYYPKITQVSTQKLDFDDNPVDEEKQVLRPDFSKFILRSDQLPPNVDEEALIDIISPVLKTGNFTWKGFYKGEIINFEMADNTFNNSVINKEIEFTNGTSIKCVLQQNQKIDDSGFTKIYKNKVLTVLEVINGDNVREETMQGKKYRRDKELNNNQLRLEFE